LSAFSLTAFAAGTQAAPISINVNTVAADGAGYTFAGGVITITENGWYTLTGSTVTNRVVVAASLTDVNITLNNVTVDRSADVSETITACAFSMVGARVNLALDGNNTLESGDSCAGLTAPDGSRLTVHGSGSLVAAAAVLRASAATTASLAIHPLASSRSTAVPS
jgi:hypothetical protein